MSFQVIPAIDVAAGRLARLSTKGIVPVDAYGGDPVTAARAFAEAGAPWIHVVDLDMAFDTGGTSTPLRPFTMSTPGRDPGERWHHHRETWRRYTAGAARGGGLGGLRVPRCDREARLVAR